MGTLPTAFSGVFWPTGLVEMMPVDRKSKLALLRPSASRKVSATEYYAGRRCQATNEAPAIRPGVFSRWAPIARNELVSTPIKDDGPGPPWPDGEIG